MATATQQQPNTPIPRNYGPNLLFSPILLPSFAPHRPSSSPIASEPHASLATDTYIYSHTDVDEMSAPIPISPSSPAGTTHKDAYPSPSTASTSSLSPHTPFTPLPPTVTPASVGNGTATGSGAGGQGGSGLLRWASLSFGKSPTSPGAAQLGHPAQTHGQGPAYSQGHGGSAVHDHDHDEHHDVFEFGDFNHMAKGSWTGHGRRAASMSMASGQNAAGGNDQSVSAMLAGGFGGLPSPSQEKSQGQGMAIPRSVPAGSPPGANAGMRGGVVADNAAKGVGVLRRLSLSGSLNRPSFLSPPAQSAPLPPQPSITTSLSPSTGSAGTASGNAMGQPQKSALTNAKPSASAGLAPDEGAAGLRVPLGQRGRRYSENSAKKRGVSPMGERILRDHGGF